MDFQTILFETRNQIAWVTFNRPESMNAMNRQMTQDLIEACRQIEEAPMFASRYLPAPVKRHFQLAWI